MLHIPEKINDQVQDNFLLEHNAEWQTMYRTDNRQNRTEQIDRRKCYDEWGERVL